MRVCVWGGGGGGGGGVRVKEKVETGSRLSRVYKNRQLE